MPIAWCTVWMPVLSTAAAQVDPETEARNEARARSLFEHGLALAEAERWSEALSAFQRSSKIVPRPSTSYNIANALYRLDRPVEGLAELDKYDAMPEVLRSKEARLRGAELRGLLEGTMAEVHLTITPATASVFVDGRLVSDTGFQRWIRLNPGKHSIRVTHPGHATSQKEINAGRGSRQAFTITLEQQDVAASSTMTVLPPSASSGPSELSVPTSEPVDDDREPFVKRPGFWVMIGAIAAAGVGIGVAVAVTRKNDSPQCGTTGNCATTQGLTVASF